MKALARFALARPAAWRTVLDLPSLHARIFNHTNARDLATAQCAGIVEIVRDSLPGAYAWTEREIEPLSFALRLLGKARA